MAGEELYCGRPKNKIMTREKDIRSLELLVSDRVAPT